MVAPSPVVLTREEPGVITIMAMDRLKQPTRGFDYAIDNSSDDAATEFAVE
jgi:hypothetical protein